MGAIARSASNLVTTSGVVLKGAINNDSFDNVTALPSSFGDGIELISSQTASNSASISFTSGLDSTYKAYKFVFVNININGGTADAIFQFNLSTDSGSNYNVTKTTTLFRAYHNEDDTDEGIDYSAGGDLAQSTSFQGIAQGLPNDADSNAGGSLTLFNPSSTTYVKHFISDVNGIRPLGNGSSYRIFVAGYGNTTSAVNAIQFKMSAGNIIAGQIYLYGIK